jgi:carbamoyl-phosphate synthase large subunit
MNILLTCAGRRNYLVEYFKEALNGEGKVFTINSSMDATSMLVADKAIVAPLLYEADYIDFIIDLCEEHNIKLVVSVFDMELPVLAANKGRFDAKGIKLAVSNSEVIEICNDKILTVKFLRQIEFRTLYSFTNTADAIEKIDNGMISYPLFIKPRWGMGSIALQVAENEEQLKLFFNKVKADIDKSYLKHYRSLTNDSVIIQEKAKGQEYGLDIINDFEGNYVTTFVKMKMEMRSGETDVAKTMDDKELQKFGEEIGKRLKHVGNLDVDVFWDGSQPTLLEMNARIGGGYPFSHLAGANLPKAYIAWAKNEEPRQEDLTINYGVKGFKAISMLSFEQQ